jgi:hypothetical protein
MKCCAYILLLTIFSCKNQQQKVDSSDTTLSVKPTTLRDTKTEICWTGTLNVNTPIFVHYQLDSNLVIGEIIYLNTKDKLPIRLLGTIEKDKNYRLLEFDKTGNITGVITGVPTDKVFKGSWFSPKSNKELAMVLSIADTVIPAADIKPIHNQIFGNYHYQYGENGFNGDFEINRVSHDKVDFNILSLTNVERGPNIAEVEKDTILMKGNSFVYQIPYSDSCEFKTTFYKDFLYINYTKGYCNGHFGLNASIDGIYLKLK